MVRRSGATGRLAALTGPIATVVTAALALAACTSASHQQGATSSTAPAAATSSAASSSSSPAPQPSTSSSARADQKAVIKATPAHASSYDPTAPVSVAVTHGRLTRVAMLNPQGQRVTGALASDKSSWHTTEVLGYGRTYRIKATAVNGDGVKTVKNSSFTTLTPDNMTMPYFDTTYGSFLQHKGTYGVGMIAVVNFDEAIPDRAAAERALKVTTTPHTVGSWYWTDDHTVHWRPRHFYQPGTKVTIDAKVYGKNLGNGLYGQSDKSISFTIGQKRISVANAATHKVKVYFGGKLMRSMPTSMGQGGYVEGKNGQKIALWTMPGTYTVINHENPAIMSSDSYGLPANSQYGYPPEKVPYATKISTDGIYLHELDTTVWAQGHENLSHGCLNLNRDNAKWYYNHSRIGDVVKVVHSGGPKLQEWQGGDWSIPWAKWKAGSALS